MKSQLYPKQRSLAPKRKQPVNKVKTDPTPAKSTVISENTTSKKQLIKTYIELSSQIKDIKQSHREYEQTIHKLEKEIEDLDEQISQLQ